MFCLFVKLINQLNVPPHSFPIRLRLLLQVKVQVGFLNAANFFAGWDRPQSVARAGVSGGILRNTGINFDTDGLNGYPTLDPTGSDTAGGSIGVDLIGDDLDRQLIVEMTYLSPHGSKNTQVPSDQYALGGRYQFNLTHSTLLRFDAMYGWRRGLKDVQGTRMEWRWKF